MKYKDKGILARWFSLLALLTVTSAMAQPVARPEVAVQAWETWTDQSKLLSPVAGISFGNKAPLPLDITVDASRRYQEMVGFGASITDASAWLIQNRMSAAQRQALMQDLFGKSPGLGLSFTRLTIGASDFSMKHYSLDDMPKGQTDEALTHFSIDPMRADVLPVVKSAPVMIRVEDLC